MTKQSQASYVARLSKAEQLHQYLLNFENYAPGDDALTTEALMTIITELHVIQNEYTLTQNTYLLATEERRKSFYKQPNSIGKILSPIGAYVKAKMPKGSRFYQEVSLLINKIRGHSKNTITKNDSENTISNSEKSYGSQLQNFKDITTLLEELGADYQPANESIKLPFIQNLYQEVLNKNNRVSSTISVFKPSVSKRQNAYKTLVQIANSIKNMVKSQFGIHSTEYNLVKGLAF